MVKLDLEMFRVREVILTILKDVWWWFDLTLNYKK